MKNNNKRTAQKQKPYSNKKEYKDRDERRRAKPKKEIISKEVLFERASKELKNSNIFLLEAKTVILNKMDNHIYAVIHKMPSVSHEDCVHTTKIIQDILDDLSFDTDDYSITVSSAGFTWVFKSDIEYEIFVNNNIKIKYKDDEKNTTIEAILKENSSDYIIIENKNKTEKKLLKTDIIKTRLNN